MTLRTGLVLPFVLAACTPDLPRDDGVVTAPRVLAVRGDPPEANAGASVNYTAFVAAPAGFDGAPDIVWDYCTAPKPASENNIVSTACLGQASNVPAGRGPSVVASIPSNACALFGPDTPPGGFRARDPDSTGGYYQPLRADLAGADAVFHLERLLCDLGMAPADIATAYAALYVPNENPHLMPLSLTVADYTLSLDAIPKSTSVTLSASWAAADAESYSYFDRTSQTITLRREAMSVAWYVSAGRLDTPATGRAEDDLQVTTSNVWTTPDTPGRQTLWVVLRDSRGGVDFAPYDAEVVP